jgi:hypothetical protein
VTDLITDNYFREGELAELLNRTTRTLRSWRQQRIGPPWLKPTKDLVLYPKKQFREWLEAETVQPLNRGAK